MWFLHEGTGFAEPKTLCVLQNILRGDFLEYGAICAQKYRHPLRESEAFCCFCQNGGVENSFDEFYAKLWSQKMLGRKKITKNKLSITFSVC